MHDFILPKGVNLRSECEISPVLLSKALAATVDFLQSMELRNTILYQYADWWEHDGLHFARGHFDFPALRQIVQSPEALLRGMPGDFSVFVGVSPPSFRWYLRFYLDPDAEENERFGRFDLTLPANLMEQYKKSTVVLLGLKMQAQEANAYYKTFQL